MKNVKRISSIVLIVCMLLTVLPSEYLFIRKNESEAYAASGTAGDVVNVALGEVGYHEGSNNYNKYAAELGYTNNVSWCSYFVSWVMKNAGVSTSVYNWTRNYGYADNELVASGCYHSRGTYTPKAGDVIHFLWPSDVGKYNWSHIGIVVAVNGSTINVVSGNSSDAVTNKSYDMSYSGIKGFSEIYYSPSDSTPPTIKNVSVTISHDYADINCEIYDNVGVAKVQFPTWPVYKTSAGCTWYNPTNSTGNSYWFRMNLSDFNNYRGEYLTHIYAWDAAGNCTSASTGNYDMTENNTPPVISNVRVTNITNYGYTVECDVSDDNGLRNIQFPTWTKAGGQDDLIWHNGTINGNHAYFNVRIADHNNEYGEYTTHIYVWDVSGNCSTVRGESEPYILRGYEPKKIEEFNGHIYAAFDVEEKWTDAKKICEDMGGHLATVTSQEEEDLIKDLCGGRIAAYFLGATDDGSEGSWHWITGEDFSYTDWEDNQPDNANGAENYLELISGSSKWNDIDGYMSRGFVFEMDDDLTPVATITYNNSIYELYNTNTSFPVAQKYCEMHGGNLVCITTAEENEAVKGLINKGSKQCYLMGGSDKEVEGTWKNVTGEPFVYSNWMEGEPNNYFGSENFMYMYKDGSWNDAPATSDNGFILEKEITHVDNITLDKNEIILEEGAADKLSAIFEPTVATNKNISWTVDDNTVATVDCNGNITAVTAGETDITATTNDGGLTAKCHVVVNPKENPVISNVVIKNKKLSGYTIECDVADNTEVKDIYLDTWTTKAVKDDEKDELSSIKGIVEDGHVVFDVDINTHNKEAGEYKNVIRAYDVFSNETQLETENVFIKNGYEPEVVFENDGHIYAIFDIADNYITANDKCIEMEGHLASIDSIDEKLAILNNITAENKKFFILSGNNEKASYIDENGKVFETGLNENVDGFIYELDKNLEPENSVVSGNKKYVAYSTCLPWEVAKVYCETHGGYLACINSEEESDTVNGLVSELGNFRYFLGATDKENEGEWKWLTNEEFLNDYWELFSIYKKPSNLSGYGKSEKDADYIWQYGYENYLVIDTEEYRKINNSKISPFWNDVKSQLVSTGFILEKDIQRDSVNAEFDAWPEGHEGESDITGVSVTAAYNDPLVLKVVAQGDGLSYVWKKNNVGIKGANEDRYEVPNVTYSATFTCTVSDVYGNTKDIEFFVAVDNELKAYVKGTTDNAATLDLKKGEEATLAVDVSALDTEGITYEWRGIYKNSSGEVYTKRVGTGDEYTFVFGEEDHDYYRYTCGVSDRFGNTCYVEFDVNDALVNTSFISQYAVVGQKIVFKGSATGGSGNYQYAYYYRKTTDSAWTTAGTEWGTSIYATAKPGTNTVYEVCIKVRDANDTSNVVKKYLSFAANTSETSLKCYGSVYKTIYKYGTTNYLTASSANASGTVKYKYEYRKASSWTYETIQDYTTSTKVSWNAPQTGSFTLRITAYDGTDYAIRTINIKVKK